MLRLVALPAASLVGGVALCYKKQEFQRAESFPVVDHWHGKTRVRVLKVRRDSQGKEHSVSEYSVQTRLFSPKTYEKVFTRGDNADLVATDTQKNTVYVIAKRTNAETPEAFGCAIADHLIREYAVLDRVEVEVKEVLWQRHDGHAHAFIQTAPERNVAYVALDRGDKAPKVTSEISGMTVLKTTQSGFEGYHKDRYTLLPPCVERCLATELTATWEYTAAAAAVDYGAIRAAVRAQLTKGLFGPAATGLYSASLQATIYDAGCLALTHVPQLSQISIDTPNLHYLPTKQLLAGIDEKFDNDVFIPTNEPSGTIFCTIKREA